LVMARPRFEDDHVSLGERPVDAELTDSGSASAAFVSSASAFASLRHGRSGANSFTDRNGPAPDGFWMMPRAASPGARNSIAREKGEVPRLLDEDEAEPRTRRRTARPPRPRPPPITSARHEREPTEHRELCLVDGLVVLGEERPHAKPAIAADNMNTATFVSNHVYAECRRGGFARLGAR